VNNNYFYAQNSKNGQVVGYTKTLSQCMHADVVVIGTGDSALH